MKKETRLFVSQYGDKFCARTIKELRQQIPGRCAKMYIDKKDGTTKHIGYVIGRLWMREYAPVER